MSAQPTEQAGRVEAIPHVWELPWRKRLRYYVAGGLACERYENERDAIIARSRLREAVTLLDHAELLIGDDTGMVVCWHEYTVDEALRSECAQCCVELARRALGKLASDGLLSGAPSGAAAVDEEAT